MMKYRIVLLIFLLLLILTACVNKDIENIEIGSKIITDKLEITEIMHPTELVKPTEALTASNVPVNVNNDDLHNSLEEIDFKVTDGNNVIILDSLFSDFKTDDIEIKSDNNYVGETYSENYEFVYKNYVHEYKNFVIYVSNTNYNLKKRSYDDYYITQITLKNERYKTNRGIFLGSKLCDVIKTYGNGKEEYFEDSKLIMYSLNDKNLTFTFNEQDKVIGIDLSIETPVSNEQKYER